MPTYKIFVAFSLCASQNKLKTRVYYEQRRKSKNNIRVALCQKTAGENTPHSKNGTIFKRWQKWPFCKGFSRAKSSKLTYLVAESRGSKIMQKMTVNTHKRCFMRKRTEKNTSNLKNDNILHYSYSMRKTAQKHT